VTFGPTSFAIIIGGMKCGTTSLFDVLAQHPEVCGSKVKEPDFFSSELDPARDWPTYLALWDWDPTRHRIALEASTSYAKYPHVKDVPEKIASVERASFRFIYMLRDPVARISSQVRHALYGGWGAPLDDGMTEDLIDFSRYAMQADRYVDRFSRERILLLTLEEFTDRPYHVLRRVCRFLEIDPEHAFVRAEEPRNTGGLYTMPPLVAGLARNPVARLFVDLLPRSARHRLRESLARLGRRTPDTRGRWKLDDEERQEVRRILADDMARLRDDYGVHAEWMG
jgi:hypothetical protein